MSSYRHPDLKILLLTPLWWYAFLFKNQNQTLTFMQFINDPVCINTPRTLLAIPTSRVTVPRTRYGRGAGTR